jgi:hypothetical protein
MNMKGEVMPALVQMGKDELQQLVTEVKETVAIETKTTVAPRKFGAVDMWNRQRRSKLATGFLSKWQNA